MSELFWSLVDLSDPDWWSLYVPSHHELEDLAPTDHERWYRELTEQRTEPVHLPIERRKIAQAHSRLVRWLDVTQRGRRYATHEISHQLSRRAVVAAAEFVCTVDNTR